MRVFRTHGSEGGATGQPAALPRLNAYRTAKSCRLALGEMVHAGTCPHAVLSSLHFAASVSPRAASGPPVRRSVGIVPLSFGSENRRQPTDTFRDFLF